MAFCAPRDGEYFLRTLAWAKATGSNAMVLTFMRDKETLRSVKVEADESAPQHYEAKFRLPAGKHHLRVVVLRDKTGLSLEKAAEWKSGKDQKGTIHVHHLEIEGPPEAAAEMLPETHRRIFFKRSTTGTEPQVAREVIGAFAKRAYRRPVTASEVERLTLRPAGRTASRSRAAWRRRSRRCWSRRTSSSGRAAAGPDNPNPFTPSTSSHRPRA